MASYVFKKAYNGSIPNGTTTLLTVPAGHIYLVKQAVVNGTGTASPQHIHLQANGRDAARAALTNGATYDYDLTGRSGADPNALVTGSADNLVLEAGDVLSVVNDGSTGTAIVSVVDYTI